MNTYYNPVRTYQGAGCLRQLPRLIQQAAPGDGEVLLLLCMEQLREVPVLRQLSQQAATLCFPHSNPTVEQLYQLYCQVRERKIGLVVAVGGGSTLDVGKSLCCLLGHSLSSVEALTQLIACKAYGPPVCPWIGVPTTAGTGSEVTCWATVWHPEAGVKYSIDTPENYAYAALADPELLATMPLGLAVSSALDAVAHGAESYWAKATNSATRALALGAIQGVMDHMELLLAQPNSPQAHDAMSRGSLLAGLAFSNTRTTACHSMSYPLTMEFGIPHGVAVSLLLGPVLALNQPYISGLAPLLAAFGVDAPGQLASKLDNILSRAGFSPRLSQWGVERGHIPGLAARSLTKGRADNNPAQLTESLAAELLSGLL